MKTLSKKGFYIVLVIIFFIGKSFTAHAQFAATNLETGGLYTALAKDNANNLYVTRVKPASAGATYEVEKYSNGSATVIYSGLTHEIGDYPWGLTVTSAGNVYISTDFTSGGGSIIELTYNSGTKAYTPSTFQTGRYFTALAVDAADNLYDTEYDAVHLTYAVVKYAANSAANSAGTNLYDNLKSGAGYTYPTGLAVAANGDIYVADAFSNTPAITDGGHVYKLTAAAAYAATTVSTGQYSSALALDASGNLYSSENSGSGYQLVKYTGGTGTGTAVFALLHSNGIYYPWGIAVLSSANIFLADGDDGVNGGSVIHLTTPAAVTISYSGPQTYYPGMLISPLAPASSGVAAPAYNTFSVGLGSGFVSPVGIAASASGNIYVSQLNSSALVMLPAGGGAAVSIGSGSVSPYGLAVDAAGNVYVADYGNSTVMKIPVGGGAPVSIGSGFSAPVGVAVDGAGNVFVADFGSAAVKEIPVGGGPVVTIGSGFTAPAGVAVDGAGNVYVADYGGSAVKEVPVGGGTPVVLGSGFSTPFSVAVDPEGNVYVADFGNNAVKEIPAGGGAPQVLGFGFKNPTGVAVDGAGNLYIADYGNNAVKEIKPAGGYFIWPFLPAGLSLNGSTGIISGTPAGLSAATNYTVTAYNAAGGVPATVNIKVIENTNLASLKLSSGTLTPVFAAGTTSYAASVANTITSITATPTTADVLATVTVNGIEVTSGSASAGIPLTVGPNVISTVVTARDGVTTKTYTVTVSRAPSANAALSHFTLTPATALTQTTPGILSYTGTVSNATASVTVTPTTVDPTATVKVNGTPVTSGTASGSISLNVGTNTITIVSTAQDGVTTKTYTLTVTRLPSSNAGLANFTLSSGALNPVFATGTLSYTASVSNATASITVTPTTADPTATLKVNGTTLLSGTASAKIPLTVGNNTVTAVVTAQDGVTTKTYTVTVIRVSTNAALSHFILTPSTALTQTTPGLLNYTGTVNYATASVTVT
ncbi:MAG: cadherin-like beta sandwich domain-containing protein, partial [Sphingobacteriales bacterium]